MCGNLESLKQEGIRDSQLAFHRQWYSSNIMNLILYGNQPMQQLEEWAVSLFSGVENKDVTIPDLSLPKLPFDNTNLGQIVRYQPVKDKDQLELYWVLPWLGEEW